ncbi:protein kinase [Nostoc sp. TCL26-01]|uniref:protein kinase domain-containing protein n=1 Tax=Nostoc sp. TCL26-01 TaxID=2576904 RepID=UPI0035630E39
MAVDEGEYPPVPCVVQRLQYQHQKIAVFEQKAGYLSELGKHPQIPALIAYFQDNQHFYLVQEWVAGANLAQVVVEEGVFQEMQIWQLLTQILPVVKFMSDRHIIHGDIKPQNIIRQFASNSANSKNFVLVDFGAAQIFTGVHQLTANSVGSPEYTAPEQAKGQGVFASDLYSLGVTCIYLLTQISPFDLFDIANDCWVWQQYLTMKVSDKLVKILNKLVAKSLTQRFQSADEVMLAMGVNPHISIAKSPSQHSPWHTITGKPGNLGSINSLAISPNGERLASGSDDKIIRLWNLNTQTLVNSLSGHSQAVTSVAFSPNGEVLATASDDKTIKLWHLQTAREIFTLEGHLHAVKSVAFSPCGQILASGSWDKQVKLWDISTGKEMSTLKAHQLQVSAVAFSPQGRLLASASFDRTVCLWQMSLTGESEEKVANHPHFTFLGTLEGHTRAILAVAFSSDGKILATGSDDNTIKLWDIKTGQIIGTLLGHSWSVVALAFSTNGTILISASWDKTIKLWQVSTNQEILTLASHLDSVCAVAVSPVTQLIASGGKDKTIKLWQFVKN